MTVTHNLSLRASAKQSTTIISHCEHQRSNLSLIQHNLSYVRDCFETSFLAMTFTCAPSLRASAKQSTTIISHCERQAKQSITYSTQPCICQRLLHDFVVRNDCHTQPVIASISEAIHHNNQSLRAKRSNLSLIQHNLSYVRDCFETSFLAMTFTCAPSLRASSEAICL